MKLIKKKENIVENSQDREAAAMAAKEKKLGSELKATAILGRFILLLVCLVLIFFSISSCLSEPPSPESTVRDLYYSLSAYNEAEVSKCFESGDSHIEFPCHDLSYTGKEKYVYTQEIVNFFRDCAGEIRCEIGEATINGDIATVPATFTYRNCGAAYYEAIGALHNRGINSMTDTEITDVLNYQFISKAESSGATLGVVEINFTCVKQNDEWKIRELSEEELYKFDNILTCGVLAMEDFIMSFADADTTESK